MSSIQAGSAGAGTVPGRAVADLKLEVVVIPVSDVDRAKEFYLGIGWRLDADFPISDDVRIVQITPPGSSCSIQFGQGVSSAAPGSAESNYLVVSDIEAARSELVAKGVDVSEVFHEGGAPPLARFHPEGRVAGPAPDRTTYGSFATFSDPDGNGWLLQEITTRLPGRIDPAETSFASVSDLAQAVKVPPEETMSSTRSTGRFNNKAGSTKAISTERSPRRVLRATA